ncbi:MAG: type II secretion system protein [Gammaproteobacteria bacterium]|nr:type II secretion system protein [Gammaproteobacteria bacterium]
MKKHQGFTLIELSLVMIILSILATGLIASARTYWIQSSINEARKTTQQMKQIIMAFAIIEKRLPCPDANGFPGSGVAGPPDGQEDRVAGACVGEKGFFPSVTLGVSRLDPWGQPYRYMVQAAYADDNAGQMSFTLEDPSATIEVRDAADNPLATDLPAIIYSLGPNTADTLATASDIEDQNIDANRIYVQAEYSPNGSNATRFDDIVVWLSPFELRARMVEARVLPEGF